MTVAILIPTFNEGGALVNVLAQLKEAAPRFGGLTVYLVDDGGASVVDLKALPESTAEFDIVLARHSVNLGQGAALETARQLALRDGAHSVFVMMDSDGQHRVEDLPDMVAAIEAGADVAFGNRFATDSNVPFGRRIVLWGARAVEFALTALWMSDAHNGYRAFSVRAMELVRIRQNRMAHATEIRQSVARHRRELKVVEVPVTIRYTPETLRKGQSSLGAVNILRDLALRFLFGPE